MHVFCIRFNHHTMESRLVCAHPCAHALKKHTQKSDASVVISSPEQDQGWSFLPQGLSSAAEQQPPRAKLKRLCEVRHLNAF